MPRSPSGPRWLKGIAPFPLPLVPAGGAETVVAAVDGANGVVVLEVVKVGDLVVDVVDVVEVVLVVPVGSTMVSVGLVVSVGTSVSIGVSLKSGEQ